METVNNLRIHLSKQSTKILKKRCKSCKLSAQGTKRDLINRIIAHKSHFSTNNTIISQPSNSSNVVYRPLVNIKKKPTAFFVPNNFRNVTKYVMEMSDSNATDKEKAFYFQTVISKFGKKHRSSKTLQICYIFCLKYYFAQIQYDKAYKCLVKLQNIKSMQSNEQYRMNLIACLTKYYLTHIRQKKTKKSKTTIKNTNNIRIKRFLQLLPDEIVIKYKLCLYKAQIVHSDDITKVLKYYNMEQNTEQLITFSEWIIEAMQGNNKTLNFNNNNSIQKCYGFCINYYYKICHYQKAFEYLISMVDLYGIVTVNFFEMKNIQTIVGELAHFYSELDETTLISGYIKKRKAPKITNSKSVKIIGKLIAKYYGSNELKNKLLFELLTDETIRKYNLCSYAAMVIHKNDINKIIKYYHMETNADQKFILAEHIIKEFNNEKNEDVLQDCYETCVSKYCDSERYEEAFDCYQKIHHKISKRFEIKLAIYYAKMDVHALILGNIHMYRQHYPIDLINLCVNFYGDTESNAKLLFQHLNDHDIVENDLGLYAMRVIHKNNTDKFLKFLEYALFISKKTLLSLYQYFVDNFVEHNDRRFLQKCYKAFLNGFMKKTQNCQAFDCYVQMEDLNCLNEVSDVNYIAGTLAQYFSVFKVRKLIFGYAREDRYQCPDALTNVIVSYYGSKKYKLKILFQRLSVKSIQKYELCSVAAEIVYKNNLTKMLKFYEMELNCLKEKYVTNPKCSCGKNLKKGANSRMIRCVQCSRKRDNVYQHVPDSHYNYYYYNYYYNGGCRYVLCNTCYITNTTVRWTSMGKTAPMLLAKIGSVFYQKNNKKKALKNFVQSENLDYGKRIRKYGFEIEYAFCLFSNKQFNKAIKYIKMYEKKQKKNPISNSLMNDVTCMKNKILEKIENVDKKQSV